MRIRILAVAALLVLSACTRQAPAPTPSPTPAAETQAAAPTPATPPPPEARPTQSETEQATASQESGDADTDTHARSDASLEKIAGAAPGAQLPAGKWQPGVNYDPVVPAQPTSVASGKVEVMEVFWLACPHCYAIEPHIRSWLRPSPRMSSS